MHHRIAHIIIILCVGLSHAACNDGLNQNGGEQQKQIDADKSLVKVNRYLTKMEKEDILAYIHRHGWNMTETGSGLWYDIYEKGEGMQAEVGKVALISYKVWLLSGELVYASPDDQPKMFKIGHGGVESGLEEGILLLREGDKSHMILPSHLAYGLLGDDNKIPPRMPIVYQVELIELK